MLEDLKPILDEVLKLSYNIYLLDNELIANEEDFSVYLKSDDVSQEERSLYNYLKALDIEVVVTIECILNLGRYDIENGRTPQEVLEIFKKINLKRKDKVKKIESILINGKHINGYLTRGFNKLQVPVKNLYIIGCVKVLLDYTDDLFKEYKDDDKITNFFKLNSNVLQSVLENEMLK